MTLVDRSAGEYPPGTKIGISKKPNQTIKKLLPSGTISLSSETSSMKELGSGAKYIIIKIATTVYKLMGSASALNTSFVKLGGGKSDTHKATRCKEAVSLIVFKYYQENSKQIEEKEIEPLLPKHGADPLLYIDKFYESAILQLVSYKKLKKLVSKSLVFEFQGDTNSKKIYDKGKLLGGGSNSDNWNPADLWVFERSFIHRISEEIKDMSDIQELNYWIRKNFLMGNITPISLKQSTGVSHLELINPLKYKNKKLDYDFSLKKVNIAGSLKSVFIETRSGYIFKANSRGAENNPTLYLEGTMKSENFAMGAIDAIGWKHFHGGKVKNGKTFHFNNLDLTNSLKVFNKYKNNITKRNNDIIWNPDFELFNDTLKRRYISAASLLDYVMSNYEKTMRYSFFSAMKVADKNSMYVKIK